MKTNKPFIEVDFAQHRKEGQGAAGDVFLSHRVAEEDRIVCVLADGLGSGIKANVLATLTGTMAMKYISSDMDIRNAAKVIMQTLPVCSRRKIGYSTFTIVDIRSDGQVRIVEYDNPPYLLMTDCESCDVEKKHFMIDTVHLGTRRLSYSQFPAAKGVRLVIYTDGISQSGMGSERLPLGWTDHSASSFIKGRIRTIPTISSRRLSREVVYEALRHDQYCAKDDISCAVINFRDPRKLLVMTGPPIDPGNDRIMASMLDTYEGKTVICGGTTANIIARELKKSVDVDLKYIDPKVPPVSRIEGVDLVTEGTLTMSHAAELLEKGYEPELMPLNAAVKLVHHFLDSDVIHFVVGTKINQAHQDPRLPVGLDIRRNLIRHIVRMLNEKYMKQADIEFI